jgi:hypothetical protein
MTLTAHGDGCPPARPRPRCALWAAQCWPLLLLLLLLLLLPLLCAALASPVVPAFSGHSLGHTLV